MSSSSVLAARDVNTSMPAQGHAGADMDANTKPDVMSMEHHRQVFQSKMEQQGEYVTRGILEEMCPQRADVAFRNKTFISPSDNIMSPCTAKLSAFRSKQVGKCVTIPTFLPASRVTKETKN